MMDKEDNQEGWDCNATAKCGDANSCILHSISWVAFVSLGLSSLVIQLVSAELINDTAGVHVYYYGGISVIRILG